MSKNATVHLVSGSTRARERFRENKRLVVGVSGASGASLAIRLLEVLNETDWEVHLIITEPARRIMAHETGRDAQSLEKLAYRAYRSDDLYSSIASGSFQTFGMVVIPCSMKTLAGIACGYADNLLLRAADVCLKERRRLVLVPRETPLSLIHLEHMQKLTLAGAIIAPPVLTMYTLPKSIDEVVDQIVGKVLDLLAIEMKGYRRWE
jgi:polyprenyl P-hydroxybenzoate/phenylacrylic acid decarboxylase-like protein